MQSEFFALPTKKAKVAFVRERLGSDQRWMLRGLVAIYTQNQTLDEKAERAAKYSNGIGFTVQDADFLTGMAKCAMANRSFTPNQLSAIRKCMPKYARQLVNLALSRNSK
jgi:hypothetical protein